MSSKPSDITSRKIADQLPAAHEIEWGRKVPIKNPAERFFDDDDDRDQFVSIAVTTIFTQNQSCELSAEDFKLIYHAVDSITEIESDKAGSPSEAVVAGIFAISEEGKIVAKIEAPTGEGYHGSPNHREAFVVLRKEVERRFNELMRPVPNLISGHRDAKGHAVDDSVAAEQSSGDPPEYDSLIEK